MNLQKSEAQETNRSYDFYDFIDISREEIAKYIYKETKRKPMILAVLLEV